MSETSKIGLFIDLDGVVYKDKTPIEGSIEFLKWLDERDIPYLLLTNNSYYSSQELSERLKKRGINLKPENLFTSVNATVNYLRDINKLPNPKVFIIGSPSLENAIDSLNWKRLTQEEVWENPEEVDYLVVGYDRDLTYRKLAAACLSLNEGNPTYIATNSDVTFPTTKGLIPGAGATLAYLKACSGKDPEVIGKPNPIIGLMGLEIMRQRYGEIQELIIVGDRLESDIALADALREKLRGVKVTSVLVLSGVTRDPSSSPWRIDIVLDKLYSLKPILEETLYGGEGDVKRAELSV